MSNPDYRLMQIIESIVNAADETLKEEHSHIVTGSLMTYAEVLTIIQEQLSENERKMYKLDFDVDAKYM